MDRGGASEEEAVVTISWRITSFDEWTLVGRVSNGTTTLLFHSTSFQSDTTFRWPRVGESVDVVFNQSGNLLSVHGK